MRRVTKLAAVVLSGSLGIASLAACGSTSGSSKTSGSSASPGAAGEIKVGMAYDVGGRGDQSFNDSAARGLDKAAADLGVKTQEASAGQSESEADKVSRLEQLAQKGFNPIIAVGFAYQASLEKVAKKYPNVNFALIDSAYEKQPENITSLVFAEEQGSYLVGVAAAKATKSDKVGFIGGVNVPLINKFEAGFQQGVTDTTKGIQPKVTYISQPPDMSGFASPDKGKDAATGMLDDGADVIYAAAGSSGNGAIEAAANKKGAWAIGVDSDQYNLPALKDYKASILTSMVKNVDVAVFDYIESFKKGSVLTGVQTFDVASGGIGYSTSNPAFNEIPGLAEAVKKAEEGIKSGKITVKSQL